ncbi:MAG: hypothetical protein SBU_001424 [Candidatus Syntrophoarchaeum butanivorans]|uniref:Uncharacterized protein n=1 Tax=Candidatus Syntropharchaeum butanivorans TaxID=1839936 RepID=A0A1F2P347_9EURY|nr:MAG: hypothetical protein SBU_001424 [Candidatus Syntrophoarchaeum butanivorans]
MGIFYFPIWKSLKSIQKKLKMFSFLILTGIIQVVYHPFFN